MDFFHSIFPRNVAISLPGGVSVCTADMKSEQPSVVPAMRDETVMRAYV